MCWILNLFVYFNVGFCLLSSQTASAECAEKHGKTINKTTHTIDILIPFILNIHESSKTKMCHFAMCKIIYRNAQHTTFTKYNVSENMFS